MKRIVTEYGLTLIELMVAMVLGLLLTAAVISLYATNTASFNSATQVSRLQENTRFATHYLTREIRQAAFEECGNVTKVNKILSDNASFDQLQSAGIYGWEYIGTEPNNNPAFTLNGNLAQANELLDDSNAAINNDLLNLFAPIAGSDIVVFNSSVALDITLDNNNRLNSTSLNIDGRKSKDSVEQGQIIKVGDCSSQDLFQNVSNSSTNAGAGGGNINSAPGCRRLGRCIGNKQTNDPDFPFPRPNKWDKTWGDNAKIFAIKTKAFYIANGSSGLPALHLFESSCGLELNGCSLTSSEEIIEGIESMQVTYGEDTVDNDQVADIYRTANQVSDFSNVVSVRVSLLMRSNNNARDQVEDTAPANAGITNIYTLGDGIQLDPPDDRLIRLATNSTIHLRNKGL